jgi:hypothetical protein
MDIKDRRENPIVDFIEGEAFYEFRKNKSEIEKGTFAIYIFATLSLLSYVMYLMLHYESFEWFSFTINILVIIIYYCLAVFSNHEPFNAFTSTICIVVVVLAVNLLATSQLSFKELILKVSLIVYISMKLEMAKKVQAYNKIKLKERD